MCLPEDLAVIFHRNLPPICARLLRYYDAPEFKWGGTGRSRRRGFGTLVRSLCFLGVAAFFAAFATDLPTPVASRVARRRGNPYQQQPYGDGQWYPDGPDQSYGGPYPPYAPSGYRPIRRRRH